MLEVGQRVRIKAIGSYAEAMKLGGHEGEITKVITKPDEQHDSEVLPMFGVQMDSGMWIEFWDDELEVLD